MTVKKSKAKGINIIGSTGSIGRNTLEVIRRNPDSFKVVALAAGTNVKLLKSQVEEFNPKFVSVKDRALGVTLRRMLGKGVKVKIGFGTEGASKAAAFVGAKTTVSAIVGAAGLLPTLAAIRAKKTLALANKEALVIAGSIVTKEASRRGVRIIPVDSEHSAVFQSLKGHKKSEVRRILLTASGGPLLKTPLKKLSSVTPEEALNHPNWSMGKRITIDSATLMNKGFEVIEAKWLFAVKAEKIDVCIHPQSVVHSMVEYIDGSIVAQMGTSDMKVPIAYAMSYPSRVKAPESEAFSFAGKDLNFMEPDTKRFPALRLAYEAMEEGGVVPAILNAADEVAVDAFLRRRLRFTGITELIEEVLAAGYKNVSAPKLEDVLEADSWARKKAQSLVKKVSK